MPAKPEPKLEIVIRRVRDNRKSVYIEYQQGNNVFKDTFTQEPLKSFYNALESCVDAAISLAELSTKDAEKIKVTGITVTPDGDNNRAVIVLQKKLKRNGRVLNLSTPILSMYEAKDSEGADHMSEEEAKVIERVIKEAKKYLAGDRAQGEIKFEEEKPKEGKKGEPTNIDKFPGMEDAGT